MDTPKSETKYERLRKIGIGSYGVVFKCVNRQTGQIVAIKRYSENDTDPIIRKIAMREVRMLRQLKHPNLIHLIEVFRRKRILHLVFDYCELTVLDVIEKYANNCPLNLIRKIIWQLVNGVGHCHAHNCIHRDIKPENILINQSGVVKLCDFGFARNMNTTPRSSTGAAHSNTMSAKQVKYEREAQLLGVSTAQMNQFMMTTSNNNNNRSDQQQQMFENNKENQQSERLALTEYVATRWYRAPELLVGDVFYDKKIDIWAIGCVTAELMRGEPVWPGKTDLDQLFMIKSSLGQLTPGQTHTLLNQGLYDHASIERLLNQNTGNDLLDRKVPPRVGQAGLEFVLICLQMDPTKRPPCDELLQHPYIQSAQMSQFVRGASHAGTAVVQNQQLGSTSRNFGQAKNSLTSSSGDLHRVGQPVPLANRTNSQAILMMANNNNNGQQPASKRLLIASDTSAGSNTPSRSYQSPKQGSLVPVPVRSRQSDGTPAKRDSWSQVAADNSASPNLSKSQQYKRKVSQATATRTRAEHKKQSTRVDSRPPVSSQRGSIGLNASSRRLSQSNGNLLGGNNSTVSQHGTPRKDRATGQGGQPSKVAETTRRDRQQTNLGQHSINTSTRSSRAAAGSTSQRTPNTNSSSSSSSSPTSFGTNKSSSTSFLPSVQR